MSNDLWLLTITAASLGCIHTLIGPDHYLPFVMMSRAGHWSRKKTMLITLACGAGHVLSSIVIGAIGILLGIALHEVELVESVRGEVAAWALISFGFLYMLWGIRRAHIHRPHAHPHLHAGGIVHSHDHEHTRDHAHFHEAVNRSQVTAWALFTIFILGPCEPLIPLLMYPASSISLPGLFWIISVFGIVTIGTMLAAVSLLLRGFRTVPLRPLERYMHALAGGVTMISGLTIQVLGL